MNVYVYVYVHVHVYGGHFNVQSIQNDWVKPRGRLAYT
jgi:hypothetical protein